MGWGGRWEGGSGWGTHVNPWLIHVNVWQKPLQYCEVISLQLIKINEKKKERGMRWGVGGGRGEGGEIGGRKEIVMVLQNYFCLKFSNFMSQISFKY